MKAKVEKFLSVALDDTHRETNGQQASVRLELTARQQYLAKSHKNKELVLISFVKNRSLILGSLAHKEFSRSPPPGK
jgi:uncharacterized protein YigA (DUF484 family)